MCNTLKFTDVVSTTYGDGRVLLYRHADAIYEVQLTNGTKLYCPASTLATPAKSVTPNGVPTVTTMELNVAYEALEEMRKFNLEVQCQENSIPFTVTDLEFHCRSCLLARKPKNAKRPNRFSRKTSTKKSPPCLACGTSVCRLHASITFRKQHLTMCLSCEELFGDDNTVIHNLLTNPDIRQRRQQMDRLLELYDRAVLLLRYSAEITTTTIATVESGNSSSSSSGCSIMDEIAGSLDTAAVTQNRVGLGSSSAGIVSGVLGIVSCATILTPIGPPLLIASLLFGGSATAAQTGTEVHQTYFSVTHQTADRIIALHGICWNILRVTGILREALLLDYYMHSELYDHNDAGQNNTMLTGTTTTKTSSPTSEFTQNHHLTIDILTRASNLGSLGTVKALSVAATNSRDAGQVVTVNQGMAASRGARFLSRSTTAALNSMQFARIGGGALSAATLLWEAHNLKHTLQKMQAGNPCDKAKTLRRIRDQIPDLPTTRAIDAECERYLSALTHRHCVMTEDDVTMLLVENAESLEKVPAVALTDTLHGEDSDCTMDGSSQSKSSFRARILMHKRERRASPSTTTNTS